MLEKIKSILRCDGINDEKKLSKIKNIYRLILDFSFFPVALTAILVYNSLRGESAILLDAELELSYIIVLAELVLVSVLGISKRFYFTKYLLFGVAIQIVITALVGGYTLSYVRLFLTAFLTAVTAIINICVLYGWKSMKGGEKENG